MKQIALLIPVFVLFCQGCKSDSKQNSDDSQGLFSREEANEFAVIGEGPVYTFTIVPEQYDDCRAVFAQSEDDLTSKQFMFATDLRESCVIAIDGRLLQIELVAKRTANLIAQFYKFEGKGYTIDLEIRQSEEVDKNLKKVRGQLRITDHGGYRDIFYIQGKVQC